MWHIPLDTKVNIRDTERQVAVILLLTVLVCIVTFGQRRKEERTTKTLTVIRVLAPQAKYFSDTLSSKAMCTHWVRSKSQPSLCWTGCKIGCSHMQVWDLLLHPQAWYLDVYTHTRTHFYCWIWCTNWTMWSPSSNKLSTQRIQPTDTPNRQNFPRN